VSLGIASAKIRHNSPTIYSTPNRLTNPAEELKTRFTFPVGKAGRVGLAVAEDQGCEIMLGLDATFTSQEMVRDVKAVGTRMVPHNLLSLLHSF
jgi:hypothetical protein